MIYINQTWVETRDSRQEQCWQEYCRWGAQEPDGLEGFEARMVAYYGKVFDELAGAMTPCPDELVY